MEESQYEAIFNYVTKKEYPSGSTKSQNIVLHRSCKNYMVKGNQLFYTDSRPDNSTYNRLTRRWKRRNGESISRMPPYNWRSQRKGCNCKQSEGEILLAEILQGIGREDMSWCWKSVISISILLAT